MTLEKKFDLVAHKEARLHVTWGTLGPNREHKTHVLKPIAQLSTAHIMAIRLTQHQISDGMKQHFANEITYRELYPKENISDG